jgi:hypothetical protein
MSSDGGSFGSTGLYVGTDWQVRGVSAPGSALRGPPGTHAGLH